MPIRGPNCVPIDNEEEICTTLRAWQDALEKAAEAGAGLVSLVGDVVPMTDLSAVFFRDHAETASRLVSTFGASAAARLLDRAFASDLARVATLAQHVHEARRALGREIDLTVDPRELRGVADNLDALRTGETSPTVGQVALLAEAALSTATELEDFALGVVRSAAIVGLREVRVSQLDLLHRAAGLARATHHATLAARRAELAEPNAGAMLDAICAWASRLREAANVLSAVFEFEGHSASELEVYAIAAAKGGIFWFLKADAKAARKAHARLARGRRVADAERIANELLSVAAHIAEVQRFQEDSLVRALVGPSPQFDDNFEQFSEVVTFVGQLRATLAGHDPDTIAIRRFLLEGEIEAVEAFAAVLPLNPPASLQSAVGQPDRMLSEIVQEARRRAELAALAARRIALVPGLRSDASTETLRDLATKLENLRTAVEQTRARAESLGPAAPWIIESLEDPERLRIAASVPALIVNLPAILVSCIRNSAAQIGQVKDAAVAFANACADGQSCFAALTTEGEIDTAVFLDGTPYNTVPISDLLTRVQACATPRALTAWIGWRRARRELVSIGLGPFTDSALAAGVEPTNLGVAYLAMLRRSQARILFARHPELSKLNGQTVEQARTAFRDIDQKIINLSCQRLAALLQARGWQAPRGNGSGSVKTYTDLALIEHEVSKKKRHIATLDLLTRARRAALALKPCFMLSPLSVAQYVDKSVQFDVLVIDEASQMRPEDAIGAFARAKRVVVVGDPQQLPPTSFFARSIDDDDEDEERISSESILDRATALFGRPRELRWHYRSRHPALIEFSNHEFYEGLLNVPPVAHVNDPRYGVVYKHVPGVSRKSVNVEEVAAVVETALRFMRARPKESLGIATMNLEQRELIKSALDRAAAEDPDAQAYIRYWEEERSGLEPLFVKNLESVQGDERDVILISTVYGPRVPNGPVEQLFGPVNSAAGHRRLNVLFTRAKNQVVLFSSLRPADVIPAARSHQGVHVLRRYLEYATTGVIGSGVDTERPPESPFEEAVIDCVRGMDCKAVPQVGVLGFRVDIGVQHSAYPYGYLLGIECDGSIWHASATARDRDRIRQEVLEGLGWHIYRIWSTEWFRDPVGEAERLRAAISERLEEARKEVIERTELDDIFRMSEPHDGLADADVLAAEEAEAEEASATAVEEVVADPAETSTDPRTADDDTPDLQRWRRVARGRPRLRLLRPDAPQRASQQRLPLAWPRGDAPRTAQEQPQEHVGRSIQRVVAVFDTVTYALGGPTQTEDKPITITITQRTHDPDNGMLAAGHMLVRQMLGLEEGEETEIQIANNTRRIRIEKIVKPEETFAAD